MLAFGKVLAYSKASLVSFSEAPVTLSGSSIQPFLHGRVLRFRIYRLTPPAILDAEWDPSDGSDSASSGNQVRAHNPGLGLPALRENSRVRELPVATTEQCPLR